MGTQRGRQLHSYVSTSVKLIQKSVLKISRLASLHVSLCCVLCVCVCVCVYVSVCVCERERERERGGVYIYY